jgi:VWFA-related protein
MLRLSIVSLLLSALLAQCRYADAQAIGLPGENGEAYRLKVAVDEVSLTFHAADAHGLPVNDLKLNELSLLDNGKPPRRIIDFRPLQDLSLRAGILIDTSESMQQNVSENRAISIEFAQRLLRQQADQAFVMDFGYISKITQPWTSDPAALVAGIQQVVAGRENPLGGTAMFDTLFRACFNVFGKVDHGASGNFILLFSDGEDNASHTSLEEVVDICQRANTAIYSFRAEPAPNLFSGGPKALADLAQQTGGRAFPGEDSEAGIDSDLQIIEADLRNQYRLIYNPAKLTHDGAFHRIELKTPERVQSVTIRSGYYDRPR